MGLFYLQDRDIYCLYNFRNKQILQELHGGEPITVLVNNKWTQDVLGYKNKKWCLINSGYIGQDLNGLDVQETNFLGTLKSIITNFLKC